MQNKRSTGVKDGPDADACWKVLTGAGAGKPAGFLYGVRTTGVYCRPGCASRLPKRENVNFFFKAGEAEAAGFRPCKRCRPNEASGTELHKRAIEKACALTEKNETAPSLDALAKTANMSRHHFHRVFKRIMGVTPQDYIRALQAKKFGAKLQKGGKVSAAVYDAGFGSSSRAYAHKSALGMTPKVLKQYGAGEEIRYTIGKCSLGNVLVAVTKKGLCMAAFADDKKELLTDLAKRFSNAELVEDKTNLKKWLASVDKFLAAPADKMNLPLDLRGTAFQARVWRMLQKIPPGKTMSYLAVAAAIGRKDAVRAVASACGKNPVSLFVPCHRVVQTGGGLGGYRWGLKRKQALLKKEARA